MRHICIVGGGFCGTMTAVHLVKKSRGPLQITIISEEDNLHRGIAYSPYSATHLLNVPAKSMSAFQGQPDHFLQWALQQPENEGIDESLIGQSYLPRFLYGRYLEQIWQAAQLQALDREISLKVLPDRVVRLEQEAGCWHLETEKGRWVMAHDVVIATGNHLPRNFPLQNSTFYDVSRNYFRNPWDPEAVANPPLHLPVLLLGNSLTMVDTVLALLERGFSESIITISPHGFNLLPHRHGGTEYRAFLKEVVPGMRLYDWLVLVNRHRKKLRRLGISAEPVMDALRPMVQDIWRSFSQKEKTFFLKRLRPLWNAARHRVPMQVHDQLMLLRLQGRLVVKKGHVVNMADGGDFVRVVMQNPETGKAEHIDVARVINCTGPETDIAMMDQSFLRNCLEKQIITRDAFRLGIETSWPGMQVVDPRGGVYGNLYALGGLLRGALWETTGVQELRQQAEQLAVALSEKVRVHQEPAFL